MASISAKEDVYKRQVKILCDELGIWCIVALSDANPDKGIKYRHAWNVIRIDGKYYHLDVTFDNTLSRDDACLLYTSAAGNE